MSQTARVTRADAERRQALELLDVIERTRDLAKRQDLLDRALAMPRAYAGIAIDRSLPIDVRCHACGILADTRLNRFAPTMIHVLTSRDDNPEVRVAAALALAVQAGLRSRSAVAPLIDVIQSKDDSVWVREMAAYALGRHTASRAVPVLVEVLRDTSESAGLRGHAAESLGALANLGRVTEPTAAAAILSAVEDPDVEVRFWSLYAIATLHNSQRLVVEEIVPRLERIVETDDRVLPGWWSIRKEARDAIRYVGLGPWKGPVTTLPDAWQMGLLRRFARQFAAAAQLPRRPQHEPWREVEIAGADDSLTVTFPWLNAVATEPWGGSKAQAAAIVDTAAAAFADQLRRLRDSSGPTPWDALA